MIKIFVALASSVVLLYGIASPEQSAIHLSPGESIDVDCGFVRASSFRVSPSVIRVRCVAVPTATPTPTIVAATPTDTPQAPTFTPVPSPLDPVDPVVLGTCSQDTHDGYVVTGPDGRLYRTWHPQKDPSGCVFAHEHGDDPRTSKADSSLPAFGYAAHVANMTEPHEGYKVAVVNAGDLNDEGNRSRHNIRVVVHTGSGGVGRFSQRFHSEEFDMTSVDGSGRYIHVNGLADTGGVGSICAVPRQGKTVMVRKGQGCDTQSVYEIWEFTLTVRGPDGVVRAQVHASPALFDPITVMDTTSPTSLVPTSSEYPQFAPYHGCEHETYFAPIFWYNKNGPTVYMTDPFGGPGGAIHQEISANSTDFSVNPAFDAESSGRFTQMKLRSFTCSSGLGSKN